MRVSLCVTPGTTVHTEYPSASLHSGAEYPTLKLTHTLTATAQLTEHLPTSSGLIPHT